MRPPAGVLAVPITQPVTSRLRTSRNPPGVWLITKPDTVSGPPAPPSPPVYRF